VLKLCQTGLKINDLTIYHRLLEEVSGPDSSGSPQGGTTEDYKRIAGHAAQMGMDFISKFTRNSSDLSKRPRELHHLKDYL